jgi:hypothetical protein
MRTITGISFVAILAVFSFTPGWAQDAGSTPRAGSVQGGTPAAPQVTGACPLVFKKKAGSPAI